MKSEAQQQPTASVPRPAGPATTKDPDVRELVELAIESLRRMQLPSGIFCHDVVRGQARPRKSSLRYTLMVYLGLLKAQAHGYDHGFDLEAIREALNENVDSSKLRLGDLGLYLWAEAAAGRPDNEELVARLAGALNARGGPATLDGMELGWVIQGLALQPQSSGSPGSRLLNAALEVLIGSNRSESGLFYHSAKGTRRRFPNFAIESYGILALTTVAGRDLDEKALEVARDAAERIISLQLPDGGWPWFFDAKTGQVVERYELYSVHQHGMAPMALLPLFELTGEQRFADACRRGLRWIYGANELEQNMVDADEGLIYRSIRRRMPLGDLWLYGNTGAAAVRGSAPFQGRWAVELNPTCCSYELGWLLEAWCGREALMSRVG